jgi:predicted lipoprotein with Yx(FWY)xxD motif
MRIVRIAATISALATVLAACSSNSTTNPPIATATHSVVPVGADTSTVDVATSPLGKVLVDQAGETLYLFEQDTGTTSTCYGDCAGNWPALTVSGSSTEGPGVHGTLGTTTRKDGATQLTLDGHPLYTFAGDQPGDLNGEGLFNLWYAISPDGKAVMPAGSKSTPSAGASSSSGSGRSGY